MVGDILKDAEKITLKNMQRGNYFRIASDVIVDGESLADMLIAAGIAIRYPDRKKTHKWCNLINKKSNSLFQIVSYAIVLGFKSRQV